MVTRRLEAICRDTRNHRELGTNELVVCIAGYKLPAAVAESVIHVLGQQMNPRTSGDWSFVRFNPHGPAREDEFQAITPKCSPPTQWVHTSRTRAPCRARHGPANRTEYARHGHAKVTAMLT